MKHFFKGLSLSLAVAAACHGQAGAEGQYDLLVESAARPGAPVPPSSAPAAASAVPEPRAAMAAQTAPRAAAPAAPTAPTLTLANTRKDPKRISDYDFGEVVQTLRDSVQPLSGEMTMGFPKFIGQIDDAIIMMDEGRVKDAVATSINAVDGVLASRDAVVNPLWEAQFFLNEQIAMVRSRLAQSMSTDDPGTAAGKATAQTAKMLDQIAARIAQTSDPVRKRRLIAHYRTVRTLSKVRSNSLNMTPDQRKLWLGVLSVLEQASLAHQQVMMGAESLFAQLDGTGMQLRDYLTLMQTIDGVDALLGSVQGGGMEGFVEGMRTLQEQMETFSESMQVALESSMAELESRVETIQETETEDGSILAPTSVDDELQSRIDRVAPSGAGKEQ